jgi:hypothetical protein
MGDGRDHRHDRQQSVSDIVDWMLRRAKPEWRAEPGPDHDLRQYLGGRPTGLVAVVRWNHGEPLPPLAVGPDVRLFRSRSSLIIDGNRDRSGGPALRLRLPLRSCVAAQLTDEPGLPGTALVRLTLTVRVGPGTCTLPLWFPGPNRGVLQRLVAEIERAAAAPPWGGPHPSPGQPEVALPSLPGGVSPAPEEHPPVPVVPPERPQTLSPLAVRRAPDEPDWLVFRATDDGAVLTEDDPAHRRAAVAPEGER